MKTLTTLTAISALVAGLSVASAQMTTPKSNSMGASGSAAGSSARITGTSQFCLVTSPGNAMNCKYASLAACQKDATAGGQCQQNPKSGTTGSGQKQ